jgi:hypothetical protein
MEEEREDVRRSEALKVPRLLHIFKQRDLGIHNEMSIISLLRLLSVTQARMASW